MTGAVMPKQGDRVRVVLEGEVTRFSDRTFQVGGCSDGNLIYPTAEHVVSVEILPEPWVPGDIVGSATDPAYVYVRTNNDDWLGAGSGPRVPFADSDVDNWSERSDVTVIRRGGKVVAT